MFVDYFSRRASASASPPADSTAPKLVAAPSSSVAEVATASNGVTSQSTSIPPSSPDVGHQARVLFALLIGAIPPPSPPSRSAKLKPRFLKFKPALSPARLSEAELSTVQGAPSAPHRHVKGARPRPRVTDKSVRKLKKQLAEPKQARKIVEDLKRMQLPLDEEESVDLRRSHHTKTCGYAVRIDQEEPPVQKEVFSTVHPFLVLPDSALPALPPVTAGAIGAVAGERTGVFEVLAEASGALVSKAGSHSGFVPPSDALGVFTYWWGFEIALPPQIIKKLGSYHSVQSTLFTFLQAMVVAGGAPEIAPFIRYLASYTDMEWGAIKAQDRGKGVVLAATWLLPAALIPRPWDFDSDS